MSNLQLQDRSTDLRLACERGSVKTVKRLLQEVPGVANTALTNTGGATHLHIAAKNSSAILELLIKHGANVNAKDDDNVTPLMLAAEAGAADSVQLLMEKGADPTIKNNDGRTALHYAASGGHHRAVAVFLQYGATMEKDRNDRTALHEAAIIGSEKSVELIVEKRAQCVNDVDNHGNTALHLAAIYEHSHLVKLLLANENQEILLNSSNLNILDVAVEKNSVEVAKTIVEDQRWREVLMSHSSGPTNPDSDPHPQPKPNPQPDSDPNPHPDSDPNPHPDSDPNPHPDSDPETNPDPHQHSDPGPGCDESWVEVSQQMIKLVEKMLDIAERLLEHCVQREGDPHKEDYKIKYDLSLILCKENTGGKAGSLKILKTMADLRRDRCLTHPLCFIVLSEKWKRFGCAVFLFNLLSFLALIILLTVMHVILEDNDETYCEDRILNRTSSGEILWDLESNSCVFQHTGVQIIHYFIIIMICFQLLKEFIQLYYQRKRYFAHGNWIEVPGLVAALISVVLPCECKWGRQKEAASVAIFLGWINLIMYFRRLPFYGKYVIMLYHMFTTLLKVLLLFVFFILAFGATFHIIIDQKPFTSFPNTLMYMLIMTLGEINYVEVFLPWNKLYYPGLVNAVVVLFCLSMPIIVMNMLVGLAVGDIEQIQMNALMDGYIMQVKLLIDIEAALPARLLERFDFNEVTKHPNKPSLLSKVFNGLIGFGPGNEARQLEKKRDDGIPEMAILTEKLEEQASEIEHLQKTMETILELVREQNDIPSKSRVSPPDPPQGPPSGPLPQ